MIRLSFTISIICMFAICPGTTRLYSQDAEPAIANPAVKDSLHNLIPATGMIVINQEMIARFNSIQTPDGIYSWSQLFPGFESIAFQHYAEAYRTCDIGNESLAEIKKNLENINSKGESLDDYLAYINQVKAEINRKLGNQESPLVQK